MQVRVLSVTLKPKQTNMKQFAFPIGVKCSNPDEYKQCLDIIKSIGDRRITDEPFSSAYNYLHVCITFTRTGVYDSLAGREENMYYIDHFNPELIRDIAAACTNDTWQEGELWVSSRGKLSRIAGYVGFDVNPNGHRRPTIAEICAHHGYEIKGRDIVKKVETVSNCDKSYCPVGLKLAEKSEDQRILIEQMDELKSKNDYLREKLESLTDADNHELARLRSKIDDLEHINAVITKELKCTQDKATEKIDELANKLQYNDKLHVKKIGILTDMISELSRDKAELIAKVNRLLVPAPAEFNPISCMHAFENRPISLTEREKKRLLRLAERIERLIK
jgi:hypothetical protein